jgi:hypothetical protein
VEGISQNLQERLPKLESAVKIFTFQTEIWIQNCVRIGSSAKQCNSFAWNGLGVKDTREKKTSVQYNFI